mgnify:CR=1 FL=1
MYNLFIKLFVMYKYKILNIDRRIFDMNNKRDIKFNRLSINECKIFKQYAKKSFILSTIFFIVLFPTFIICGDELNQKNNCFYMKIVWFIIYISIIYSSYVIYFLGKPKGVVEGKVSKKNSETLGKYSGYKYNIYLSKTNQTIKNIRIWPSKKVPVIQKNDPVIVFKTWLGFLFVVDKGKEDK